MNVKVFAVPVTILLLIMGTALEAGALTMNPGNGHSYDVIMGTYDWNTANTLAVEQGYHLATLTDASEQAFVQSMLSNYSGEFWLGAHQDPNQTVADLGWSWVTGEAWDYTNWAAGEANDWNGIPEMDLGIWSNEDWQWNDEHGRSNIAGYVIESDNVAPVPEPATIMLLMTGLAGLGLGKYRRRHTT